MKKISKKQLLEFLNNSNWIESEYSPQALEDSLLAWNWLAKKDPPLDVDDILCVHKLLMHRLWPEIAGKIRHENVQVGGRVCPSHDKAGPLLEMWCETFSNLKTEKDIKRAHIEFEFIHPFRDGNGRVGRLIFLWQYVNIGLPLKIIYEKNKYDYYTWFH